ncbi:leucine-rich repeat-domain-containing protein [Lentinula raphanica]|uniref:U2 small nuclear ribonucleoprotein A' n=1 Tax=Lentinula raphanica TaxID=153919 RepID=A0AA38P2G0_9AGAR|nr:L domain-like protein [Lentinula raphanica]KAJ3764300.1 leucine-rich repeat-domain-containing protein [Lentinula raphanica]KAJ3777601.1 leucine-rich repeat-domain-containing protein [Lentinula raphanica]KAJ3821774.1 leucine-rich repeat-domain-containing protein [Lentinula raphanica]KAJ3835088.1 leucine-rich repeat-domain-containing protein [Lentinula raphanica]
MKLTPELLAQAPSALNPTKERQLDLRGYKIPAIENLGVTRDQQDAIDLTDNSITVLGNLPLLKRLRTLFIASNRISSISPSIHLSVPNLTTLILTNNDIAELGDLEPLKELKNLKYLSLLGNPVREKKWYREWLAWRIPGLRVLDFQRIRDKERSLGKQSFLTADNRLTALAETLSTTVSTSSSKPALTTDEPRPAAAKAGRLMSKEDAERVKAAIAKATSIEEIRRLERSLRDGYMPEMESVGA